MNKVIQEQHIVPTEAAGKRLDHVAVTLFASYSRVRIQEWIKQSAITVNGVCCRPKDKLFGGETITLDVQHDEEQRWLPQDIAIHVVYSDDHIIVVNKTAGLVVHPGAGVPDNTLLNALLHHYPELGALPRAGIVHRLDKDTSGLMVVARSLLAHTRLVQQLQQRSLGREYEACIMGELISGGVVNQPIGRHPTRRIKMAVSVRDGKEAITHYRLLRRFKGYSHVTCQLETGRTHQIRVHMAHIKHPLLGDPVYLNRQRWTAGTSPELKTVLTDFPRQALHAKRLTLQHPQSGDSMTWEAELPEDMQQLLNALVQYA